MTAAFEDSGPTYLSARSSDVILSDIRPIKLKVEALRSVNAFLDELLWTILSTSRSLATDRIKASLLKVIPTTLGKEALLEAEVELKAYWERTNPRLNPNNASAEGEEFPLQWSFELLRFKCEAYSTLNDSDEDINAEARLSQRMKESGYTSPPPPSLVAPAALYLTAIIEYVCEHILSNVSRVIARDSSRTVATPDDLFVALCEDGTVYNTFKSMKVYDQIENLLKSARPQRSKSFSRDKIVSLSRTPSLHSEISVSLRETATTTQSRLRMSSDSLTSGAMAVQVPSRSSAEKIKMKLLLHGRASSERGRERGPESSHMHRRTDSSGIEGSKGYEDSMHSLVDSEDQILKDEFDELMRSGSTMKVSLTPDRLKSMEVYNMEKTKRGIRRTSNPDGMKGQEEVSTSPENDVKRLHQALFLNHVDSIIEDEEDMNTGNSTAKMTLPPHELDIPPTSYPTDQNGRLRSLSASQAVQESSILSRKSSWNSFKMRQNISQRHLPSQKNSEGSDKLSRTRKLQGPIENMDLDDIMNSPSEEPNGSTIQQPSSYKGPTRATTGRKVSSNARELINFLNEGPPVNTQEQRLDDMISPSLSKSKSGRLQRVMLLLKGGSSTERLREEPSTPRRAATIFLPETPKSAGFSRQSPHPSAHASAVRSYPNVIIGTPPRPPRLVQPTTSPEDKGNQATRSPSKLTRKAVPSTELVREPAMLVPPSRESSRTSRTESKDSLMSSSTTQILTNGYINGNATKVGAKDSRDLPAAMDGNVNTHKKQVSKRQAETSTSVPSLTTENVDHLRRLLANATTADECRVLVDMFLARIGFPVNRTNSDDPYALSTPDPKHGELENSIVEILLDCTAGSKPLGPTQVEAPEPQNINPSLPTLPRSESFRVPQDTQLRQDPRRTLAAA